MHFDYRKLRIEPERIGITINATDHDCFLYGLSVPALMEKLFESIGVRAKLSGGGLITRQLISRLGGVDGARVFKIPGVRRLFKAYGPRDAFTKKAALELIGKKDPNNPQASFADHRGFLSSHAISVPTLRRKWSSAISLRRVCFVSVPN